MSLEAAAGKNPVSHVGKIYNVLARDISETLIASTPGIAAAECLIVSRIGRPVNEPAIVQIKLATRNGEPFTQFERQTREVVNDRLAGIPKMIDDFIDGTVGLF
jgi:S-adenosylmethionine synthetase